MTDQEQLLERARATDPRLVIDRYGMETIQAIVKMIRETHEQHPPDATCECEAMNALKVVLAADDQLHEQRDELDRQLRDVRPVSAKDRRKIQAILDAVAGDWDTHP